MTKVTLSRAAEGINIFDFLMSSSGQHAQNISFSPDDGKKFRRSFEQKYGPKGKHLIDSLGYNKSYAFPEVTSTVTVSETSIYLLPLSQVSYYLNHSSSHSDTKI